MAESILHAGDEHIDKIVFLDEATVSLRNLHGTRGVYVDMVKYHKTGIWPQEAYEEQDMTKNYSVNVISTLHKRGQGWMIIFDTNLTGNDYANFLEVLCKGNLKWANQDKDTAILYKDNAPSHRSACGREAEWRLFSDVIKVPPYSPDLNPIENMWALLKAKLEPLCKNCSSQQEFEDLVQICWNDMPLKHAQHCWLSFKGRLERVIEANGGHINTHKVQCKNNECEESHCYCGTTVQSLR